MLLQSFMEAMQNRDIEVCASMLHEDFIYIEETTMETRDEWLEATAVMFESSYYTPTEWEATARFETKDMGAIEYTAEKNGHRQMISRVPL
ncbi:MAG: DUF4440 domain-containing protein [Alphaproteobacteria bacterium]|nr:DUF4440 domain-containing protein [Alphaproteobacteria bacterium]